jgi:glucose/arabinose dehydrogenase
VKRAGADEIYSYGLRNPFRFSFDREERAIAIADVGQSAWEEINYAKISKASGANFGWDAYEGYVPLEIPPGCPADTNTPLPEDATFPILTYPHSSGNPDQYTGCAVIGGPVVRDERLESLYGRYLYSDSCDGGLQSFLPDRPEATGDRPTAIRADLPSSITEGRKHRVYVTSLSGPVYRLDPSSGPNPAAAPASSETSVRAGDGEGAFRAKKLGNFENPVYVTGPEGAKGLRFVVEKAGKIKTVGPSRRTSTFLNISGRVADDGERGLLSVAFPPDYSQSGLFYIYYTDDRGDIVVDEFKRSADNPRKARPQSRRRVIRVKHRLASNHNGGQVEFGPDGLLYLATGDGGSGGDPDENSQNLDSLLGKLIRIDPRRSGNQPYTVPGSNPFVGVAGRDEIYSYGLRNPFRFSFDRQGGHLVIADVGQDTWEEIDYVTPSAASGANFGWDAFEGFGPYDSTDASPIPAGPVTPPIHQYKHTDGNCSITGGYISRDPGNPSLDGRYLYADFCKGQIRSLIPDESGASDDQPVAGLPSLAGIAGFGEDTKGRVYIADLGSGGVYTISRRK